MLILKLQRYALVVTNPVSLANITKGVALGWLLKCALEAPHILWAAIASVVIPMVSLRLKRMSFSLYNVSSLTTVFTVMAIIPASVAWVCIPSGLAISTFRLSYIVYMATLGLLMATHD